jgi:hypothetical protein
MIYLPVQGEQNHFRGFLYSYIYKFSSEGPDLDAIKSNLFSVSPIKVILFVWGTPSIRAHFVIILGFWRENLLLKTTEKWRIES